MSVVSHSTFSGSQSIQAERHCREIAFREQKQTLLGGGGRQTAAAAADCLLVAASWTEVERLFHVQFTTVILFCLLLIRSAAMPLWVMTPEAYHQCITSHAKQILFFLLNTPHTAEKSKLTRMCMIAHQEPSWFLCRGPPGARAV